MLLFIGIAFVALLVLGLPIGMILLALSVLYVLFEPAIMDLAFAQRVITGTQSFPLLAVPLFILTGELMNISGITRRVMDFARKVSRGDFDAVAEGRYSGETEELKNTLERMVVSLKAKIAEAEAMSREAGEEAKVCVGGRQHHCQHNRQHYGTESKLRYLRVVHA